MDEEVDFYAAGEACDHDDYARVIELFAKAATSSAEQKEERGETSRTERQVYRLLAWAYSETCQFVEAEKFAARALDKSTETLSLQQWSLRAGIVARFALGHISDDDALCQINDLLSKTGILHIHTMPKLMSDRAAIYLKAGLAHAALANVPMPAKEQEKWAKRLKWIYWRRGQALECVGEKAEALRCFGRVLTVSAEPEMITSSARAIARLVTGDHAEYKLQEHDKELAKLDADLQIVPRSPEVDRNSRLRRAQIYAERGWLRAALQDVEHGIELGASDQGFLLLQAGLLQKLGRTQAAQKVYEAITRKHQTEQARLQQIIDNAQKQLASLILPPEVAKLGI